MAIGNVKISGLTQVEDNNVKGTAYFPFSDKFGKGENVDYESKKISLNQIASYISEKYPNAKSGFGIGTCHTAAETADLTVAINDYKPVEGAFVAVTFKNAVPANATLNINKQGASYIFYKGSYIKENIINADDTVIFGYDGEHYIVASLGGEGGSEVEIGTSDKPEGAPKLYVDTDEDPQVAIDVYTREEVDAKVADTVHLSAQTLTEAQKAQARDNIGVVGSGFQVTTDETTGTDIFTALGTATITHDDTTGADVFSF